MLSVFRFSSPLGSNVYFVNTDPAVIIDTGHPLFAKQTATILKEQVSVNKIAYILCTHAHGDHIGGIESLRALADISTMIAPPENNLKITEAHKREINLEYTLPEFDHYLSPDQVIPLHDDTIRVIPTPGHADEHCCFYFEKRRYLFTGDLLANDNIGFLNLNKPFTVALDEMRQSLHRCELLDTARVFTGHGEPYRVGPWKKLLRKLNLLENNSSLLISHTLISPFLFYLWAKGPVVEICKCEQYIVDHTYLFDGFLGNCTRDLILQEFRKLAPMLALRGVIRIEGDRYVHTFPDRILHHWYK